jgi:hypothetical protein
MARSDGGLFSLLSFDAAQTFTTLNRSLSLIIEGITPLGSIQTFSGAPAGLADVFQTFLVAGFTNLLSVNFYSLSPSANPEFALDNINVSAVPLPAALPLFATAVGGLALAGWARRRKAAA